MNISIQEILTQAAGFLVLVFLLKRYFWKSILETLDNRRDHIRKEFDSIESTKQDVERMKTDYAAHLKRINEEAREALQKAVEEGRGIAREIQEDARKQSQATFEATKESLDIEVEKARLALRQDIAGLAIQTSEQILREALSDDQKNEDKILEIIDDLEKKL